MCIDATIQSRKPEMPSTPNASAIQVRRVDGDLANSALDSVAVEEPLEIQIGQERHGMRTSRPVSVTMRTPGHDGELAVGFLFGEAILSERSDVADISFPSGEDGESANRVRVQLRAGFKLDGRMLDRNFYATSSCGVCGKASIKAVRRMARGPALHEGDGFRLTPEIIHQMPARLRDAQELFEHTGGLHAAALFDAGGNLLSLREDVGRHNAVDKVIGAEWLASRVPIHNRILFVSGRASFELVQKAVRAGIPALAAVGAPSSLAVELARASGMTLLGFVRGGRFNIYAASHRILDAAVRLEAVAD
ncbi:MAG: formate dehydrogenase accessory sulfurtransferase FdhD [Terrimicrobiaceae bacterium]|nr:formate dehydrogenase accessory sulfurtransferase FdhD [Terrimicrobiaceae bacterium]